jgi:indolepyruvate ferredoxin oxidoreductase alpha subunit
MTGHQPHPGVDMGNWNLEGYGRVSIEDVVKGIGVQHVSLIKPFKIRKSVEAIKEAVAFEGVSVVIAKEICTLYAKGLKQLKERAFQVTDKCKDHKDCISSLGCPAFYIEDKRVKIDADLCVGCAVCAQICPENAILPVKS